MVGVSPLPVDGPLMVVAPVHWPMHAPGVPVAVEPFQQVAEATTVELK